MKLRINGNAIRLRLNRSEIVIFGEHGLLEEKTEFINGITFVYALERKAGIDKLEASFQGNMIRVFVPEEIVNQWTTTDIVGYDDNMDIGNDCHLKLLIEKDFACLENSTEDQKDNFPNPNALC